MKNSYKFKSIIERLAAILDYFSISLLLLYGTVYFGVLNQTYLMKQYTETFHVDTRLQMSEEDLGKTVKAVLAYMKGLSDSPNVQVTVKGEQIPFLNDKEICHMEELAHLIRNTNIFMILLAFFSIAATMYFVFFRRRKTLLRGCAQAVGIIGALAVILLGLSFFDLTAWIDNFHKLFFKGTNWVLNPATDRLIYLCPAKMFQSAIVTVSVTMGVFFIITLVVCILGIKKYNGIEE